MTELSLIFGITFISLTFSGGLLRWISGLALGEAEQTRVYSAVARASEAYFWRVMRASLPILLVVAPALGLASWLQGRRDPGGGATAAWCFAGSVTGFLLTSGLAFLTIQVSVRVASRAVEAAREEASHAMVVLLRGTGICSLLADTLSITAVAAVVALRAPSGGGSLELLRSAVLVLPSLGLGVAVAALLLHSAGATFHSASEVASRAAREHWQELHTDDERDPALIAALVGDHVGVVISRTVDAFLVGLLANVAAVIGCLGLLEQNPTVFPEPLRLLALPLLMRAVGLIATGFGMMAARSEESQDPIAAIWRGLLTTTTVTLSGLAGSCLWILGKQYWAGIFLASALGLILCSIAAQLPGFLTRSTAASSEIERREGFGIGKDLGTALQVTVTPVLLLAVGSIMAHAFGEYTALIGGGALGLIAALSGMCSIGAYMLAAYVVSPLAANVKSVASLPLGRLPHEAQRRVARIDNAAFSAASVAQAFYVFVGGYAVLLSGIGLSAFQGASAKNGFPAAVSLAAPAVLWSGVLGGTIVLGYVGAVVSVASRVTLATLREAKRQLAQSEPQAPGMTTPEPFTPNYRTTLETVTQASLERAAFLVGSVLLGPTVVSLGLRLYLGKQSELAVEALLAFVVSAGVTTLALGLATHAARLVLERLRGATQSAAGGAPNRSEQPTLRFGALIDLLGDGAGPSAQIFVKALAMVCLTLTPLIV